MMRATLQLMVEQLEESKSVVSAGQGERKHDKCTGQGNRGQPDF
jgi:hypothetical protein